MHSVSLKSHHKGAANTSESGVQFAFHPLITMSLHAQIEHLRNLAEAEDAGDKHQHHQLLAAIRKLQLQVETPIETASRINFQVRTPSFAITAAWTSWPTSSRSCKTFAYV